MDFNFAEEQNLLRDSVSKFVQDRYEFEERRKIVETDAGYSPENWKTFSELGWLSLPFDEQYGGFGGNIIDAMVVMEEFGKALVVEPFLSTVGLAGPLLQRLPNEELKQELLPGIIAGQTTIALAYSESGNRHDFARSCTQYRCTEDGYILDGEKISVLNGSSSDYLLVVAKEEPRGKEQNSVGVLLVDRMAPGISIQDYSMVDGYKAANVSFTNVTVPSSHMLNANSDALESVAAAIDEATILLCAEALGAMEALCVKTVDYCKTRKQFGVAIGKFQVLQHRLVEMFMAYEQTKSMLYMAAIKWRDQASDAQKSVSALKVQACKAGRYIGQQAVQLHGGIGMTDELDIGHYFKRLTSIEVLFGNKDYHLMRMSGQR